MRLAPDGRRVALSLGYSPALLFVFDLGRSTLSRVAEDVFPTPAVWTNGGESLVYASAHHARGWNLAWRRADGAGDEERLSTSEEVQFPATLSPNGILVYAEATGTKGRLMSMALDPGSAATPLFGGRQGGQGASFSPDGHWLAYDSWETGRLEVYVRPFPAGD